MQNYNIKINHNKSSKEKEDNEKNIISNELNSNTKKEYKKHLDILIRLLIYQKEAKEKINDSFTSLNEQKKESVFLINSDWIEKFKNFFEYYYIESFLHKKYKSNVNSNSDDNIFEEVIVNIPQKYFNKLNERIQKNSKFNKKVDNISQENCKVKIDKDELDIKYLCNFQIINQKIFGLLMSIVEGLDLNKCELYHLDNEKLFLKFPNGICDEIGFINDKNIFIPEFILYSQKEIDILTLNKFFFEKFNNISENKDKPLPIKDIDKNLIGYCFSLEYITQFKMKQEINENTNAINIENDEDENISNSPISETNGHNNINNQNNTNHNNHIRINSFLEKNKNNKNIGKQNNKKSEINEDVQITKESKDKIIGDNNNSMNIGKFNLSD